MNKLNTLRMKIYQQYWRLLNYWKIPSSSGKHTSGSWIWHPDMFCYECCWSLTTTWNSLTSQFSQQALDNKCWPYQWRLYLAIKEIKNLQRYWICPLLFFYTVDNEQLNWYFPFHTSSKIKFSSLYTFLCTTTLLLVPGN